MLLPDSEDIARRAKALYEASLKSQLEPSHTGEFVAIEPDSGDYFLGDSLTEALRASSVAHPAKRSFVLRVGAPWTLRVGVACSSFSSRQH